MDYCIFQYSHVLCPCLYNEANVSYALFLPSALLWWVFLWPLHLGMSNEILVW